MYYFVLKLDNAMTIAYLSMGPLLFCSLYAWSIILVLWCQDLLLLPSWCILFASSLAVIHSQKDKWWNWAGESVCSDLDFYQRGSTCLKLLRVLLIFLQASVLKIYLQRNEARRGGLALLGFWLLITDEWINLTWPVTVRSGLTWRSS